MDKIKALLEKAGLPTDVKQLIGRPCSFVAVKGWEWVGTILAITTTIEGDKLFFKVHGNEVGYPLTLKGQYIMNDYITWQDGNWYFVVEEKFKEGSFQLL